LKVFYFLVITYVGINLTNKKFQVGSTTDFERRCKEHHKGKGDLEFQRSLRKNPENFYWVQGEDDGLDDRSEEQYMLDFYCGSMWCYNHNPSASAPPSPKGRTWKWPPEKVLRGEDHPLYGTKHTEEWKEKRATWSQGADHPMATPIILTHPDGAEEYFPYLTAACEKYNLQQPNLRKVASGERKQHKGFKARFV
jgi:predicted GIY-YIG superfamily endonuclease